MCLVLLMGLLLMILIGVAFVIYTMLGRIVVVVVVVVVIITHGLVDIFRSFLFLVYTTFCTPPPSQLALTYLIQIV